MFSSKGQTSMPFELLIAVILMGFVMFVGLIALDTLKKAELQGQIQKQLEEIVQKVEAVSQTHVQQNLSVTVHKAGKNSQIKIFTDTSQRRCSIFCGSQKRTCTLISYTAEGFNPITLCLNISATTVFGSQSSTGACVNRDIAEEELVLVDWRTDGVLEGKYILDSPQTLLKSEVPTICAYKKK